MKTRLTPLIFSLAIISCHKNHQDVKAPIIIKKPEISISQSIDGCKVQNNSNYPIDTSMRVFDSIFVSYKQNNSAKYDPVTVLFDTKISNGQLQSISWKVGADPLVKTSKSFELTFNEPVGTINVTAFVTWTPTATAAAKTDTIVKNFTITSTSFLLGSFKGNNDDSPADTFTVSIGELNANIISSTDKFWGIQNLFKGFPYNLPIYIRSSGFGMCAAPFPYIERYKIDGKYYSQPYALATLSTNKDSIYINYSYVQYKDQNSFDSIKTIGKFFKGKKL